MFVSSDFFNFLNSKINNLHRERKSKVWKSMFSKCFQPDKKKFRRNESDCFNDWTDINDQNNRIELETGKCVFLQLLSWT